MSTRTGKQEENLAAVIRLLIEKGFCEDGKTRQETVKFVTMDSYPLPGAVATFGGRKRFALPETNWKVTVGKRTVFFYQSGQDGATAGGHQFQTGDFEKIKALVEELTSQLRRL